MSTINGVTFNLKNLSLISTHRNKMTEQPGSDTNFITDMGYTGLTIKIDGYETSLSDYDDVMTEFMTSGEQTLVIRTGWQFKIHSTQALPSMLTGKPNYYPYSMTVITSTPYRESTSETTRIKTITTNDQEWSADNSSVNITTSGTVEAVPNITITSGTASSTFGRDGLGHTPTDAAEYTHNTDAYNLEKIVTLSAVKNRKHLVSYVSLKMKTLGGTGSCKITYQAASLNAGVETNLIVFNETVDSYVSKSHTEDVLAGEDESMVLKWYVKNNGGTTNVVTIADTYYIETEKRPNVVKNAQILNIADTSVKMSICNDLNPDAIIYINTNYTSSFTYATTFANTKFWTAAFCWENTTHDAVNDELDIADNGYIYFDVDCKYPITEIPTLTSQINITSGTPTIQISSDAVTWYDIDTVIVDNVNTVYNLNNIASLSLTGKTFFYFRIDCVKAAAATCSIKSFTVNVNIITIDALYPTINTGSAANTFRCDQASDSGLNCTVKLKYRSRSWA